MIGSTHIFPVAKFLSSIFLFLGVGGREGGFLSWNERRFRGDSGLPGNETLSIVSRRF